MWKIGLAVSGGADSTALAVLMARLQVNLGFRAVILHVNHNLRTDSGEDVRAVRQLARNLRLPFHGTSVKIVRRPGESLEMAARRERLNFFAHMTKKFGLDAIATGHHADDVAETFLMRLARGSGPDGLAGIKQISHVDGITFIRPLIAIRDRDLRAFLMREGISWREDSTNADTSILRNRVRHVILPFLRENLDPNITEHICKSAAILRHDLTRPSLPDASRSEPVAQSPAAFVLRIEPTTGFKAEPGSIGTFPAIAYMSRKRLAGRTLEIRTRKPGDRIVPTGLHGHSRKLQDVLVTAKVPKTTRDELPLIVDATTNEILWVPGYRVSESAAVENGSAPSWRLTLSIETD